MGYHEINNNKIYLDKITSEHRIRPKYMATNTVYLDKLQDVYDFYLQILYGFDLNTATGEQLDFLGDIVGIGRVLDFEPYYADSKLDDEKYRKLIRAKISTNQWDGTMQGLISLWKGIFDKYNLKIYDTQDMSIIAEFSGIEDLFEAELINHGLFAPCGQGVGANYRFIMDSKINGQLFISGIVFDEITDQLENYNPEPGEFQNDLYIVGGIPLEIIVDWL